MSQSDIPNPDNLPEPIAALPENLSDRSDRTWETVNLPNSMNVDELEEPAEDLDEDPTPEAAAGIDELPLDYEMLTIAQSIEAHNSLASIEEQQLATVAELNERIDRLENLLSQYQGCLDEQKLSAQVHLAQIDEKNRELQLAQEQINHLSEELEVSQEEIRSSQITIAQLSEHCQESQQRLAQLERECATTQQRYNEQVQLNRSSANTCRELRSRLHRQQRQALQFKAALEKSLEHQDSEIGCRDAIYRVSTEGVASTESSKEVAEDVMGASVGSVLANSVPIEPWSTISETQPSDLGEKPEAIVGGDRPTASSGGTFDKLRTSLRSEEPGGIAHAAEDPFVTYSTSEEFTDPVRSVGSWNAPIANDPSESFWPEENNLIQTIRDMVSTEGGIKAASDSGSENIQVNDNPIASSFDETLTTVLPHDLANTDLDTDSSDELDSYLWEIPEVEDLMNSEEADGGQNWPAPVVYPERSMKKRRSLASVELPSFPTKR